MDENKALICKKLGELLKLTHAGQKIAYIKYDRNRDEAEIHFQNSFGCTILDMRGDSGAQLIADVVKYILK